ncbi:MAG: recombination mediator RecR [Bacteroidales bacterium]|nr:recombination mediator RecR [Bacteroidales bacterium]MEE1020727.1 recombination mediator RecR [Bacteroidales bacterium]MEE1142964.1 recombination mediator RecR [Bacteroidales bacterium]MEE1220522.1 recombination mediator RecR [Bacteroidales bacterium]MEE1251824.1 recombination mediator RecR [Bacteroidales bacterium]
MYMEYTSLILENAVNELAKLPGVGQRTALRFALHLLKQNEDNTLKLAKSLVDLVTEIKHCKRCNNLSDSEICSICANSERQSDIICVVENIREVMAIESTNQYKGLYHVLGGVISPIEGIGVGDIAIEQLIKRVEQENIKEIILALPTTMEGDTTSFYINKLLEPFNIKISAIARGVAIGDKIEYADEQTLARSILNRRDFSDIYK